MHCGINLTGTHRWCKLRKVKGPNSTLVGQPEELPHWIRLWDAGDSELYDSPVTTGILRHTQWKCQPLIKWIVLAGQTTNHACKPGCRLCLLIFCRYIMYYPWFCMNKCSFLYFLIAILAFRLTQMLPDGFFLWFFLAGHQTTGDCVHDCDLCM